MKETTNERAVEAVATPYSVTDDLRKECAAEWDYLLNKTFSSPQAVEHLAQFVAGKVAAARPLIMEEAAGLADDEAAEMARRKADSPAGGMSRAAFTMAHGSALTIAQAIRTAAKTDGGGT